jgi:PHD/YefM family antitoxin component YafN of YafNO toxin-antitoxin module
MTRYLEGLFSGAGRVADHLKDRVADRVADRLADAVSRRSHAVVLSERDYAEYMATVEVLDDPELMAALRESDAQPDDDARSYDEIRRDLGLAKGTSQTSS